MKTTKTATKTLTRYARKVAAEMGENTGNFSGWDRPEVIAALVEYVCASFEAGTSAYDTALALCEDGFGVFPDTIAEETNS